MKLEAGKHEFFCRTASHFLHGHLQAVRTGTPAEPRLGITAFPVISFAMIIAIVTTRVIAMQDVDCPDENQQLSRHRRVCPSARFAKKWKQQLAISREQRLIRSGPVCSDLQWVYRYSGQLLLGSRDHCSHEKLLCLCDPCNNPDLLRT